MLLKYIKVKKKIAKDYCKEVFSHIVIMKIKTIEFSLFLVIIWFGDQKLWLSYLMKMEDHDHDLRSNLTCYHYNNFRH